jgi:hypothetical protein
MTRVYEFEQQDDKVKCACGKHVGIDKGSYVKMIAKAFTHTGTKRH